MAWLGNLAESLSSIGKPVFEIVFKYWLYILLGLLVLLLYLGGAFNRWL